MWLGGTLNHCAEICKIDRESSPKPEAETTQELELMEDEGQEPVTYNKQAIRPTEQDLVRPGQLIRSALLDAATLCEEDPAP